jgi:hypothetical protein
MKVRASKARSPRRDSAEKELEDIDLTKRVEQLRQNDESQSIEGAESEARLR